MQLNHVREWKDRAWTRLYEAALFERDTVKLCASLWEAQLAILSRQREIQEESPVDLKELMALRKALGILADLRRLSGFDQEIQGQLLTISSPHLRTRSARAGVMRRKMYQH